MAQTLKSQIAHFEPFLENKWKFESVEKWKADHKCKLVIVCGGVISGVGKGILTSSLALTYKQAGYDVSNFDANLLNPYEHGECFVLDDGWVTDLDMGNYERFLDIDLKNPHSITSGRVFMSVLKTHFQGAYSGKTLQFIPFVTDRIMECILYAATIPVGNKERGIPERSPDIMFVEIGGTVGDYEGNMIYETIRQLRYKLGPEFLSLIMVGYIPTNTTTGEHKTKPFQNSIRDLRTLGLNPDFLLMRSESDVDQGIREKIANVSNLNIQSIFSLPDTKDINTIPMKVLNDGLFARVCEQMKIPFREPDFREKIQYNEYQKKLLLNEKCYKIVITGKYSKLEDSYHSISWSLKHASLECGVKIEVEYMDTTLSELSAYEGDNATEEEKAEKVRLATEKLFKAIQEADGIIVPGGFGRKGVTFKYEVMKYCRENKKPMLGICYGFQLGVVEFAKNVCGMKKANTRELQDVSNPEEDFVIDYLDTDVEKKQFGEKFMRLGAQEIYMLTSFVMLAKAKIPLPSKFTEQTQFGRDIDIDLKSMQISQKQLSQKD